MDILSSYTEGGVPLISCVYGSAKDSKPAHTHLSPTSTSAVPTAPLRMAPLLPAIFEDSGGDPTFCYGEACGTGNKTNQW